MEKRSQDVITINEEQVKRLIDRGIKKLEKMDCTSKKGIAKHTSSGAGGAVWCLGFIGAAVYFIQQATSFGAGVVGVLKALVWPAYLVYYALELLAR